MNEDVTNYNIAHQNLLDSQANLRIAERNERVAHTLFWLAIIEGVLAVLLCFTAVRVWADDGAMCGDCNNDHKVTVAELVTAVHNALEGDPCHEGCAEACFPDSGNCPCTTCNEFPVVDGVRCAVSICEDSDEQVRACHTRFRAEHPDQCSRGGQ